MYQISRKKSLILSLKAFLISVKTEPFILKVEKVHYYHSIFSLLFMLKKFYKLLLLKLPEFNIKVLHAKQMFDAFFMDTFEIYQVFSLSIIKRYDKKRSFLVYYNSPIILYSNHLTI